MGHLNAGVPLYIIQVVCLVQHPGSTGQGGKDCASHDLLPDNRLTTIILLCMERRFNSYEDICQYLFIENAIYILRYFRFNNKFNLHCISI